MGVGPLIEKLEKEKAKGEPRDLDRYEEQTDSDSDDDDDRFSEESENKLIDQFEKKFKKHEELLDNFTTAETLDDAFKWMKKIDKFEEKHFRLRPEYRVIGELMNRLKVAEGKEKFLLQVKLNRALRMVEWKDAFDPNDPANYGVFSMSRLDLLLIMWSMPTWRRSKTNKKLAELDHTFGKKGKLLEEEIRDLAEERNSLTEQKRKPLYRKGFDVKLIDVNRTCKVTKGGQVVKYTAMLACGNYHGVVGFAKAKGPSIPVALQKVYLWPASTQTGMKAGRTVQTVLSLAGFKNVKSKV
ncbi:UNVERIFIED_CONTAM: 30S ribosomal protein S5 [Sesamum radiatum]|uniref:30S ribosomal protein S5 n=1 Tax=Sesamum radiatum TaxID=300843 RepID=A0AAW2K977_SESRA